MCVTYQHEVDVEIKDLVAHVDAEVVAEMVPQVGESPRRALEVCARHLHPLDAEPRVSGIVCAYMFTIVLCVCVSLCLTSSDTLLSMAPNIECKAPTEKQRQVQ